ncbi:MAG: Hsp20/alpha crystallin family protein [bacterium]
MDRKMRVFWTGEKPAGEPEKFDPPIDMYENNETLVIEVELPGVAKSSLRLFVEGEKIIIEGAKTEEDLSKKSLGERISFLQMERKFGGFLREVELPVACNNREARAVMEHGVLIIRLPLIKEKRGRRQPIPIE